MGNHILDPVNYETEKEAITFFAQGVGPSISEAELNLFFDFAMAIAKKHKNRTVIIRDHPVSPIRGEIKRKLSRFNNIEFMSPSEFTLSEVMSISKVAVSFFSSTLYEALFFDVVPFSLNLNVFSRLNPNLSKMNIGVEVYNLEEGIMKITELLNIKDNYTPFIKNINLSKNLYFHDSGSNAVVNITNAIEVE